METPTTYKCCLSETLILQEHFHSSFGLLLVFAISLTTAFNLPEIIICSSKNNVLKKCAQLCLILALCTMDSTVVLCIILT